VVSRVGVDVAAPDDGVPLAPGAEPTPEGRTGVVMVSLSPRGPADARRDDVAFAVRIAIATATTATTTAAANRCFGERNGQPHSLRYTAARPRLVLMGMTRHS
jgi:hypothetical protein